jgi:hypothetical protein
MRALGGEDVDAMECANKKSPLWLPGDDLDGGL